MNGFQILIIHQKILNNISYNNLYSVDGSREDKIMKRFHDEKCDTQPDESRVYDEEYNKILASLGVLHDQAKKISVEVTAQNNDLDNLTDNTIHTQNKFDYTNNRLTRLLNSNTKYRYCCMIVLFVMLLIMLFLVVYG